MKIKSLYLLCALFVGVCCMTSCEEDSGENTDELATIYWNKSAAFQMQLKGKVKTMVADSITTTSFNKSGTITSIITDDDGDVSSYLYTYSSGRLTREIYSWSWDGHTNSDTTDYTYGTSGKYLPISANNVIQMRLFRNIASLNTDYYTTRFEASGDSVLMISSHSNDYGIMNYTPMEHVDTTSFTFNGGLFPVTIRRNNSLCNLTYASDGRFLTAEEEYFGLSSMVVTFKSDNTEYLLPLSVEYKQAGATYATETYTYNENDDIISKDGQFYDEEYSDYIYDSKGNWISRGYRGKGTMGDWSAKITQTRQFTYWE